MIICNHYKNLWWFICVKSVFFFFFWKYLFGVKSSMGNGKTANLRFLELRNLKYKGYKIHQKNF